MNFSDSFKQSGMLCRFSPDGLWLANVVQHRLIIRDATTLIIGRLFTCLDAIQYIEWSSDSQFIVCGMYKRSLVQIWSMEQSEWTCKIDEGSAGLIDLRWSPDSRHILTTADFHLRITVWSLVNKSVSYIKHPKPCPFGMDFTKNGKYLAVAERRDCKDFVSIFDCTSWQLLKHIDTETDDLGGLQWSPDGNVLCVWESCLMYKVLIFSLDGRCLATYRAYDLALGIKQLQWSSTSQFLAIGSYDEKLRLLNHLTWKAIIELTHPSTVNNPNALIYKEVLKTVPLLTGESEVPSSVQQSNGGSHYEILSGSVAIPSIKPDPNKANPRLGVGLAGFSNDCKYIFTRNDNMPTALWIWEVQKLRLSALLLQESPIRSVSWDPMRPRLALCTASSSLYIWSPKGTLSVQIPGSASFVVQDLKWHSNGNSLVLISRDQMCVCFILDENEPQRPSSDNDHLNAT